jgi:hypothetical protein
MEDAQRVCELETTLIGRIVAATDEYEQIEAEFCEDDEEFDCLDD